MKFEKRIAELRSRRLGAKFDEFLNDIERMTWWLDDIQRHALKIKSRFTGDKDFKRLLEIIARHSVEGNMSRSQMRRITIQKKG